MLPTEHAPAAAQVHRPVLQGRQPVAGLWWPSDWFSEAERAQRIVQAWRAGAVALRFEQGDLLRYPTAEEQACEGLPGWPLRQEGGALCSAALDAAERARLPAADLWIVLGGEVLSLQFDQGTALDPALWISLHGPALQDTYDCREALPEPVVLAPEARSMREVLGGKVPPASAEQAAFREALARAAQRGKAVGTPQRASTAQPHRLAITLPATLKRVLWTVGLMAALAVLPALLRDVLSAVAEGEGLTVLLWLAGFCALLWLLRRIARAVLHAPAAPGSAGPGSATGAASGSADRKPTLAARRGRVVPQRWREWLARLAYSTQLGRLMGRQHAAYMRRMLELFDRGDLDEALRHAIPLGDEQAGSLGQAFGALAPRRSLQLSGPLSASTSLDFGSNLQEHLRQLYRRSFERLDREGRIDEAVFVLAELLNARQEALDYLERHERYAQAAELALAWDRPADVIVRLHCLAGDWQRALAVARRDNAFANAVLQLEKKWPDAAHRLRAEWGEALAQKGEWLAAVDAVWPAKTLRERAGAWLLAAESAGGELAARALVQRAVLMPDTIAVHSDRLLNLRDDRSLHRERAALARALLQAAGHGEASRALAALVAGPLLADQAEGHGGFAKAELQKLVTLSGDAMLQADMPASGWPAAQARTLGSREQPLTCNAPTAGAHAILDAVPLEGRRYLLALGEAGAAIVDAEGRVLTRFAIPVQRLVMAGSRQMALAIARRDRVWRVSRLDLAQRRISDLGQCELDAFATEFDGIGWTVGRSNRLQVLDTGRSLHDVLWQVSDLPGPVLAIQSSGNVEHAVVGDGPGQYALWRYELPQRRLFSREPLPQQESDGIGLLHPSHGLVRWSSSNPQPGVLQVGWTHAGRTHELTLTGNQVAAAALGSSDWLLFNAGPEPDSVCLAELRRGFIGAVVRWPNASDISARCCGDSWLLFDPHGRLLHLDTTSSEVTQFTVR